MGITVIDFGNVESRGKFGTLDESTSDGWLAELVDAKFKEAKTGTLGIELSFKVTDPDAVDTDGNEYKGRAWDRLWFSEKALGIVKDKLSILGVDVDNLVISTVDDIKDLARDLKSDFVGAEVRLVTELKEKYDDDTVLQSNVKYVNEA